MLDSGGERAGGRSAANVRVTVDGTGVPLTPRKRGTGAPLTLPRRAGPPTALKAALLPRGTDARSPNVGVAWVPGRFSEPSTTVPGDALLCCLGDGWPSRDRAVDAPALQDVPAWDGIVAWLLRWVTVERPALPEPGRLSFAERICPLLRAMWREVDLIAYGQFSPR